MFHPLLLPSTLFSALAAIGLILPIPDVTNVTQREKRGDSPMPNQEELSAEINGEETLASLEGAFRCTIYYTPREAGFTADGGFDTALETRPGLNGRMFPRDFLLAVQKEGYGRVTDETDGYAYISYCRGSWKFAQAPMDCRGRPLIARQSCAVKSGHKLIRLDDRLRVSGSQVPPHFENLRWLVSDTGSGLNDGQIDLYWGEDDPSGPGKGITFPKGGRATIEQATILVLR
jgi:hypothetical protein